MNNDLFWWQLRKADDQKTRSVIKRCTKAEQLTKLTRKASWSILLYQRCRIRQFVAMEGFYLSRTKSTKSLGSSDRSCDREWSPFRICEQYNKQPKWALFNQIGCCSINQFDWKAATAKGKHVDPFNCLELRGVIPRSGPPVSDCSTFALTVDWFPLLIRHKELRSER